MIFLRNFLVLLYTVVFLQPQYCLAEGAQSKKAQTLDTNFIADYHNDLVLRLFGSRKYTSYALQQDGFADKLNYRPNSPFNIGVGFNYRLIGLNIGFNLPFINQTELYGKTRFLDLQSHFYGRKIILDFYLQRYKGFYVPEENWFGAAVPSIMSNFTKVNEVYQRPDLRVMNTGLEVQYLINGNKFSFRGAFLQNEVQLRSAGSPLLGFYLGNVSVHADSSIIPQQLHYSSFFNNYKFYHSELWVMNASIGYAYTLVLPHSFFITAAGSGAMGINNATLRLKGRGATSSLGANVSGTFRLGLGYNGRRYFAGIHYVGTRSNHHTPIAQARQELGAGNFRVSIAHRISPRKKLFGFY